MATISSSSTIAIGAGSSTTESVSIPILPLISPSSGKGRLIHPDLGTLDYPNQPDEWVNVDNDVIIPPIWTTTKTLKGSVNVLSQADIRDVIVEEHWTQEMNVTIGFLRMLIAFWCNPPDPTAGVPVQWWPNYATTLGFNVALLNLQVGSGLQNGRERSDGITLNSLVRDPANWVTEPVTLTMRILGRV